MEESKLVEVKVEDVILTPDQNNICIPAAATVSFQAPDSSQVQPQPQTQPQIQLQARMEIQVQSQAQPAAHTPPASTPTRVPEHIMHKNRLQEYTQRSSISLPVYQTVNLGFQHAPKFRSSVLVDGMVYTSPNTFSHRKAAEQDVAKVALECISKKIRDEGCPLIREDTVFCKSILNEFAVKMNMENPIYNTVQSGGLLPTFVSSLVFNGVSYTGEVGRTKKEAEQLAARAVIISLLGNSEFATILSEIIKSKARLYVALHKVKDPATATSQASSIMQPSHHDFMIPTAECSTQQITLPIAFVPLCSGQPSEGPQTVKRRRKNKKKANKKLRAAPPLPIGTMTLAQTPPCSVAQ